MSGQVDRCTLTEKRPDLWRAGPAASVDDANMGNSAARTRPVAPAFEPPSTFDLAPRGPLSSAALGHCVDREVRCAPGMHVARSRIVPSCIYTHGGTRIGHIMARGVFREAMVAVKPNTNWYFESRRTDQACPGIRGSEDRFVARAGCCILHTDNGPRHGALLDGPGS